MSSRILLVDDDRLLREVIGEYLSSRGYEVDLAEDGEHALAKFSPGRYRLAILDLVMPGMNGLELMAKILAQDKEIFCLIMTGYPTIDSAYKSMIEGASDYIIKPFQLMELLNIVQKFVP
ncbi:MAG: response regulator [Candidatus Cloacimonadaceae bacterium]|nr:response regulator [Candidatus Cloacimonadaceae bacterium]MDP3115081.1 response regulator [Candidatus Cloacimonadaceae bacterium]